MNLLCLSDFNEGGISAKAGEVCWFMPDVARWLVDSWPGAWCVAPIVTVEEVVARAIDAPPVDKMISAPARAKGRKK